MRRRCGCSASEAGERGSQGRGYLAQGEGPELTAAKGFLHRNDLHGYVADFSQEAIEHRAAEKDVEAGARPAGRR